MRTCIVRGVSARVTPNKTSGGGAGQLGSAPPAPAVCTTHALNCRIGGSQSMPCKGRSWGTMTEHECERPSAVKSMRYFPGGHPDEERAEIARALKHPASVHDQPQPAASGASARQ